MSSKARYDAVVVGAGPNGLAAAITLAEAGCSVLLIEAAETVGGGCRSAALTLPGFVHDICSAIHPLGASSPRFRTLPLEQYGLNWVHPSAPFAHPFDDGRAAIAERSLDATAERLGADGPAYRRLMTPLVEAWDALVEDVLGPLPLPPRHFAPLARFGVRAVWPARALAQFCFRGEAARALFAGLAAHSVLPLDAPITAAFGLVLGASAHAVGWPMAQGGSQRIADALAQHFRALGGEMVTGWRVESLRELPSARATLLDVTPRQFARIAGDRLPAGYRRQLMRYRYGAGAFKVDYALDGPIPWKAPECARAATVHLGGALDEIAEGERAVMRGRHPERPFVLLAQHTLFDPSRAPAGGHTCWAYCHVPHGSTVDMTERIEAQIERFAPGFRERILARHVMNPAAMERYNANYIGGDINGGAQDLRQLYTRPTLHQPPYATPVAGLYLCSSSTPPGGGVHGMCGYHAARLALKRMGARVKNSDGQCGSPTERSSSGL
ncbi:MAG: FAD-dependent oxidoreductase [Candidatus Roseilinea sp.]|nr:MAG: FAD-dependent oxidoreductase [Candidatus Roseilinea sp.]